VSGSSSLASEALDLATEFGDAVHLDLGGDSGTASTRPHSAAPVTKMPPVPLAQGPSLLASRLIVG